MFAYVRVNGKSFVGQRLRKGRRASADYSKLCRDERFRRRQKLPAGDEGTGSRGGGVLVEAIVGQGWTIVDRRGHGMKFQIQKKFQAPISRPGGIPGFRVFGGSNLAISALKLLFKVV